MKPTVTIGMCVRNCENSIKEAISSILDQDFPHELMEVIFVDDGSEDQTLSVVMDSVSRMDMQAKVFHSEWKGLGSVRNKIVNNASGDYIIWVDGDMVLSKDFVKKQVEFLEENPHAGIAKGKYGMRSGESVVATLENISFLVAHYYQEKKMTSNLPGTGGAIYRVKAIKQVGGFDERIRGTGEDMVAAYRIKEAGWSIYPTSAVFYERSKEEWRALWAKYFAYGYGMHHVLHRYKEIERPYEMIPPAAFFEGILYSIAAYKLMRRKVVFLLPIQFIFKMTAWCLGFAKSHMDSYGH